MSVGRDPRKEGSAPLPEHKPGGRLGLSARAWARLASWGLGAVILMLGGFAVLSAVRGTQSTDRLTEAQQKSDAYNALRKAIDRQGLLEHRRAVGHDGVFDALANTRFMRQFDDVDESIHRAVGDVLRHGSVKDRDLARRVDRVQERYHAAMGALLAANQRGAPAGDDMHAGAAMDEGPGMDARSDRATDPDPATAALPRLQRRMTDLQQELSALDATHSASALAELRSLGQESRRILVATLIASSLAITIFALLALILRDYQRRDERARLEEIRRLEEAAFTDNLTGLRNRRAFEEDLLRELRRQQRVGGPVTLVLLDLDHLKQVNDRLGHQEGDTRLRAVAACMTESMRGSDAAYRIGGDEFALLLPESPAIGALQVTRRIQERLSAGSRSSRPQVTAGIAEATGPLTGDELTRRADLALYDAKHSHQEVAIYASGLEEVGPPPERERTERRLQVLATSLARAVDVKDSSTRSHSETVAELCGLLAEELELDPELVARLRMAGLLHDIGKIGISESILRKPSALSDGEYEVMKTHPALGHGILVAAGLSEEGRWILHHHERVDGGGYPQGLRGEEIPFESRILLVADAFEAITADRPYRRASSHEAAIEELKRHAGTQFDPRCVAALERIVRERRFSDSRGEPATASPRSDASEDPSGGDGDRLHALRGDRPA